MRIILVVFATMLMLCAQLASSQADPLVLTWEDLIPKLFNGKRMTIPNQNKVLGMPTTEELDISKEELKDFLGDIQFMKDMQPQGAKLNVGLDGKTIRIPGYVTPVGFSGENVTEFLLVPYLGACIHVPPPPANQIVYVKNAKGLRIEDIWEPIWLTGTLMSKSVSTVLADVGYTLTDGLVQPYDTYPEDVREAH